MYNQTLHACEECYANLCPCMFEYARRERANAFALHYRKWTCCRPHLATNSCSEAGERMSAHWNASKYIASSDQFMGAPIVKYIRWLRVNILKHLNGVSECLKVMGFRRWWQRTKLWGLARKLGGRLSYGSYSFKQRKQNIVKLLWFKIGFLRNILSNVKKKIESMLKR